MEITFETKNVRAFRECVHQIKRTQLSMEQVVPDISDDIGKLYSVQPSVLLKSKDLTTRGASVTGELNIALLYVNELGNKVFDLHITQGFALDYDLPDPDPELITQIKLFVSNVEARAVNPRKISVTVEVGGELTAFKLEENTVSSAVSPGDAGKIFTRQDVAECTLINAVCEKTFVLNEQYPFIGDKPAPISLVSEKLDFRISEKQLIGSKVLIKGQVFVTVCYLSEQTDYPITADYSSPFSQLIDIGLETMDNCSVKIEPTSIYFSLIDTISGEKALDAEIHAVAQIVSRFRQEVNYLSDAYSVFYPSALSFEGRTLEQVDEEELMLENEERIELPEDTEDVLCVLPGLGQWSCARGKAEATVLLDILYRNKEGSLTSARRLLKVSAEGKAADVDVKEVRLRESSFRPENNALRSRIKVELLCERHGEMEIQNAVAITLSEEEPYDLTLFPSITAVRTDTESIWDLAKEYHSSCEKIKALNQIEEPIQGKMLLIPKCL